MEIVSIARVRDIANAYMEHPGLSDAINKINASILEVAEQGGLHISICLKDFDDFESYKNELIRKLVRAGYNASVSCSQEYIGGNFEDKLDISWHD
jgi:serine protease inhibitor ecotin